MADRSATRVGGSMLRVFVLGSWHGNSIYARLIPWPSLIVPPMIVASVLLIYLVSIDVVLQGFLGSRVFLYLGRISFPAYLLHFPVLASVISLLYVALCPVFGSIVGGIACIAMLLAVTLGLCAPFHTAIESPSRHIAKLFSHAIMDKIVKRK